MQLEDIALHCIVDNIYKVAGKALCYIFMTWKEIVTLSINNQVNKIHMGMLQMQFTYVGWLQPGLRFSYCIALSYSGRSTKNEKTKLTKSIKCASFELTMRLYKVMQPDDLRCSVVAVSHVIHHVKFGVEITRLICEEDTATKTRSKIKNMFSWKSVSSQI